MSATDLPFPRIKLKGSPQEVGWQCGRLLEEQIRATAIFYREFIADQFRKAPGASKNDGIIHSQIDSITSRYADLIRKETPEYAEEIEAVAAAAKLPQSEIYMINCRSELVCQAVNQQASQQASQSADAHECTAVVVPEKRLLAQTWDWHPRMEDLLTIIEIDSKSAGRLMMLAEPGIIGKFGLNENGLGLLLTILFAPVSNIGIPVHLLLRKVIESNCTSAAHKAIRSLPRGSTASLTFCDRSGDWRMLELRDQEIIEVKDDGLGLVHSNHYLAETNAKESAVPASHGRVRRGRQLYQSAAANGTAGLMKLLSDREGGDETICRSYGQGKLFEVGTVAALVIDLPEQTMFVAKGQPRTETDWYPVQFD